jgi:hypothetical protein
MSFNKHLNNTLNHEILSINNFFDKYFIKKIKTLRHI